MGPSNVNPDRPFWAFLANQARFQAKIRPSRNLPAEPVHQSGGNSTIASPVATFSPAWLDTRTSIKTQRDFDVTCLDFTTPVDWMVSPGRTGLTQRVSRRR